MSQRKYQKFNREYRKKDRLYPDRGSSIRPWEASLKEAIRRQIAQGLVNGYRWAKNAACKWHIDPATGQFLP